MATCSDIAIFCKRKQFEITIERHPQGFVWLGIDIYDASNKWGPCLGNITFHSISRGQLTQLRDTIDYFLSTDQEEAETDHHTPKILDFATDSARVHAAMYGG